MHKRFLPKWGVWICAAWALALAVLAVANLLLLTQAAGLYHDDNGDQTQIWVIFLLNVCFGLAFAASTYGLWRQKNWGRLLFLWSIVVWSGFNFLALFAPEILFSSSRQYTTSQLTTNGVRFMLGMIVPLLYLNLPRVKALFYTGAENIFESSH